MSSETERDLFGELSTLLRPNHISEAHGRALEFQQLLDEYDGTLAEKMDLLQAVIDELDATCEHCGHPVIVNGRVSGYLQTPSEAMSQSQHPIGEKIVANQPGISHGYYAMSQMNEIGEERLVLYHLVRTPTAHTAFIHGVGNIYHDSLLYVPVDGSAEVCDLQPTPDIHLPLLNYYLPDLLEDVDVAVLNSSTLTDALQSLSHIDLSNIPPALADPEIQQEFLKYLVHVTGLKQHFPHQISHINEIAVEVEQGYLPRRSKRLFSTAATLDSFCLYPATDSYASVRFALRASVPFDDGTIRQSIIPLSNAIHITEPSPLPMVE